MADSFGLKVLLMETGQHSAFPGVLESGAKRYPIGSTYGRAGFDDDLAVKAADLF